MRLRRLALPAAVVVALGLAGGAVTGLAEASDTDGLTATYHAAAAWDGGQLGGYTITNTGPDTVRGWTLVFRLPEGAAIDGLGGGTASADGQNHVITAADSTAVLEPGASAEITFTVVGASGIVPADCFINDHECAADDPGVSGRIHMGTRR